MSSWTVDRRTVLPSVSPSTLDAVQRRILAHYANGTELSATAVICGVSYDEVVDVVETMTGFDRKRAGDVLRKAAAPTRPVLAPRQVPERPVPASRPEARRPVVAPVKAADRIVVPSGYERVAEQLREAIQSGRYTAGCRLPGERKLADQYKVAPKTIERAMRLLKGRGLVEARGTSGTYVTAQVGETPAVEAAPAPASGPDPVEFELPPAPDPEPAVPDVVQAEPPAEATAPTRLGWWDAFLCLICNGRSFLPNPCCGGLPTPVTVTITAREVAHA